jgi:hypothetical protein
MTTRQAQIDTAAESIRLAYKVGRWFQTVSTAWAILAAHAGQKSTKLKMKADLVAILISSIHESSSFEDASIELIESVNRLQPL